MLRLPLLCLFAMPSLLGFFGARETPVRATFGDGQILMGDVHTKILKLQSGSGLLEIPLEDVGEVVPVATGGLGESEGRVDVWLRNGSELRGTWADPKLAMSVEVGGSDVPIDLPLNDLARFQLQGGAAWPTGPVYRMHTTSGDDFLVDPTRTQLVLVNRFGTFEPKLSECVAVAPVGAATGDWRIELQTGTVLIGRLQDDKVTVALPMGPDEISVALENFVSLRMEHWGAAVTQGRGRADDAWGGEHEGMRAPPVAYEQDVAPAMSAPYRTERKASEATAVQAPAGSAWFDSAPLDATKRAQDE